MNLSAFIPTTYTLVTRNRCPFSTTAPRRCRSPVHRHLPTSSARSASNPDFADFGASSSSNPPPQPPQTPQWEQIYSCDVLQPISSPPCALLVFIGGLGAGMSPPSFYGNFLRRICDAGKVSILAARLPAIPSTDHLQLARAVTNDLSSAMRLMPSNLPVIGMGHSLGSKLLLLASVDAESRPMLPLDACIFLSFNNSRLRQALPDVGGATTGFTSLLEGLIGNSSDAKIPAVSVARDTIRAIMRSVTDTLSSQQDFSPDPEATLALTGARFPVRANLIVSFYDDDIDDGSDLVSILKSRFGQQSNAIVMQRALPGTHLTPVAPDFSNSTFASLGNVNIDDAVRRAGLGVTKEVDAVVATIVAFIRLYMQTRN